MIDENRTYLGRAVHLSAYLFLYSAEMLLKMERIIFTITSRTTIYFEKVVRYMKKISYF